MNREYTTPTLYAHSSKGDVKVWKGWVDNLGDKSVMNFSFGLLDGKQQTQTKTITEGKNIGRSNETTHFEQAVSQLESKMNKKRDSGYGEDKENIEVPILPMLALPFEKRKHNIEYPCYVQPKIDGVRMTCRKVDGKIEMFTRKGKPFTIMTHIEKDLIRIFKHGFREETFYLDGELYSDTLTFQELAGVVRRSSNDEETLKQIHYVVFDCFDLIKPFWEFKYRYRQIVDIPDIYWTDSVRDIPTIPVLTEKQIFEIHTNFTTDGHEGTMVRNEQGLYKLNSRSSDLQKLKTFLDDEYEIVGFKEGTGTDDGCVIWECKTQDEQTFSVRPKGSKAERQGYFQNGNKWIGSKLTVRYQELTDDGIPRFPVGITIRNYE